MQFDWGSDSSICNTTDLSGCPVSQERCTRGTWRVPGVSWVLDKWWCLRFFSFIKIYFSLSFGKSWCSLVQCKLFRATELQSCSLYHTFSCAFLSLLLFCMLPGDWLPCGQHPWAAPRWPRGLHSASSPQVITTALGKREGIGNSPCSVGSPCQLYQSWTDISFITSSHPTPCPLTHSSV